uniref:Capsid protein n=1 Tax=Porcine associated porprismacovirus TaxID=2496634 RepID=A0A482JVU0_9VIRU|nr:capsid protein [Porcine associated porprismacovirus]
MVKASVMEIYDLQTTVGKGTVLKVHTPTGNNVKRHLLGHFLQYKKFKYLGAKVSLIPASTLPADPLQLSYDAGEANIDPRDMVNPILWKHYHGETMLTDVNPRSELLGYAMGNGNDTSVRGSSLSSQPYNKPSDSLDYVYPSTLMDTSFRKSGVQSGFSTFVKPFIYNVVTATQLLPMNGPPANGSDTTPFVGNQFLRPTTEVGDNYYPVREDGNGNLLGGASNMNVPGASPQHEWSPDTTFTTNKLVPLGWMDTLSRTNQMSSALADPAAGYVAPEGLGQYQITGDFSIGPNLMNVPMLYVLMPPAYKTEFFFRMIIKHYFAFKGFRSCASVQSFASAGIINNLPAPPTSASTSAVAKMVADIEGGGPETVEVENGTLIQMADGAGGEE